MLRVNSWRDMNRRLFTPGGAPTTDQNDSTEVQLEPMSLQGVVKGYDVLKTASSPQSSILVWMMLSWKLHSTLQCPPRPVWLEAEGRGGQNLKGEPSDLVSSRVSLFFCCCAQHKDQKQHGEEGACLAYTSLHIPSQREGRSGAPGRDLQQRLEQKPRRNAVHWLASGGSFTLLSFSA